MSTDAWLAIAHHLAVFAVLAVLAAEWALVRPGIGSSEIRRLGRIDAAYGAVAALVLVAGIGRVVFGAKPESFYTENPVFWFKIGAFAAVGLLSIRPSIRYAGWRRAVAGDDTTTPAEHEVVSARRAIHLQLAVFAAIPVLAALMARGIGR